MARAYLAAFTAALLTSLAATPLARRAALHLGILDYPDPRKLQTAPVPYLGGMAIILAFGLAVAGGALLTRGQLIRGTSAPLEELSVILGGAALLSAVGLWDDLKSLAVWQRATVEIALGLCLFAVGVRVELFGQWPLDLILTVGWVFGVTNAINYLDNMDGLTGGVSAICAAVFFGLAALSGQFLVASLAAALTGCAIGFLWYNRPPARIFMGDSGSLFFGFMLAALGIKLRFENIEQVTFFVPVAVLAIPIFDTLFVSISRIRRGVSPIRPGKDHVSHRLVKIGIPPKAAVGLLYFASAACGWLGVVIAYARPITAYMIIGWMLVVGAFFGWLLMKVRV